MNPAPDAQAVAECQAGLRQGDFARYLTTLLAPSDLRALLLALYSFNRELAAAHDRTSDPLIAAMRLQWWREAIEALFAGRPRAHPVISLLDWARGGFPLEAPALLALIDPREDALDLAALANAGDAASYARRTSGRLQRLGAALAGGKDELQARAEAIGTAHGLARLDHALDQELTGAMAMLAVGQSTMSGDDQRRAVAALRRDLADEIKHLRASRQAIPRRLRAVFLIDCETRQVIGGGQSRLRLLGSMLAGASGLMRF